MQNFLNSIICIILSSSLLAATAYEDIDIDVFGETNFSKEESESLKTSLKINTKYKIYEPSHKRWAINLNNIINPDIDHFHNEIKINVFTTIGIDF